MTTTTATTTSKIRKGDLICVYSTDSYGSNPTLVYRRTLRAKSWGKVQGTAEKLDGTPIYDRIYTDRGNVAKQGDAEAERKIIERMIASAANSMKWLDERKAAGLPVGQTAEHFDRERVKANTPVEDWEIRDCR